MVAFGNGPTHAPRHVARPSVQVMPSRTASKLLRFRPLFRVLNGAVAAGVARHDWCVLKQRFARHDVWFTVLRTPQQTRGWAQAEGIFDADGLVRPPLSFAQ